MCTPNLYYNDSKTANFGFQHRIPCKKTQNLSTKEFITASIAILLTFTFINYILNLHLLSIISLLVSLVGVTCLAVQVIDLVLQFFLSLLFLLVLSTICFVRTSKGLSGNLTLSTSCNLAITTNLITKWDLDQIIAGTFCEFNHMKIFICGQTCFYFFLCMLLTLIITCAWFKFKLPFFHQNEVYPKKLKETLKHRSYITFWQCYVGVLGTIFTLAVLHTLIRDYLVGIPLAFLMIIAATCWISLKTEIIAIEPNSSNLYQVNYGKTLNFRKQLIVILSLTITALTAVVCVSIRIKQIEVKSTSNDAFKLGTQLALNNARSNYFQMDRLHEKAPQDDTSEDNHYKTSDSRVEENFFSNQSLSVQNDTFWENLKNRIPNDLGSNLSFSRNLRFDTISENPKFNTSYDDQDQTIDQQKLIHNRDLQMSTNYSQIHTVLIASKLSIASLICASVIFTISLILLINLFSFTQLDQKILQNVAKCSKIPFNFTKNSSQKDNISSNQNQTSVDPSMNEKNKISYNFSISHKTKPFTAQATDCKQDPNNLVIFHCRGVEIVQDQWLSNQSQSQYNNMSEIDSDHKENCFSLSKSNVEGEKMESKTEYSLASYCSDKLKAININERRQDKTCDILVDFDPSVVVDRSLVEEFEPLGETVIPEVGVLHIRVPSLLRTVQKLHIDNEAGRFFTLNYFLENRNIREKTITLHPLLNLSDTKKHIQSSIVGESDFTNGLIFEAKKKEAILNFDCNLNNQVIIDDLKISCPRSPKKLNDCIYDVRSLYPASSTATTSVSIIKECNKYKTGLPLN